MFTLQEIQIKTFSMEKYRLVNMIRSFKAQCDKSLIKYICIVFKKWIFMMLQPTPLLSGQKYHKTSPLIVTF
jgi:hypothetical protein